MDPSKLNEVPLFASLPEDAKKELAVWMTEVEVSSGKHLVDQGDYAYNLFVIEAGKAEVYVSGKSVAELGPGDFFGEIGVLEKAQRSATVVAKTRIRMITLSSWDVARLKKAAPDVLDQLNKAIEERRGGG
jgi:CRP-like cAMP-binding protein